ncbi:TPX2, C-terminal [Sesbania bispinosa]|nr:TPX2, C-terminal [Sesbania bispinosa]
MGDSSACFMQPFCYASGLSNEANKSNPIHALGQSVSFGRFMSESLAWEKWSSFSQNRYVEEAERISRPGSVAQMKAFFEAHYKKLAAQKAAALLEQANSASQTDEALDDNTDKSQMKSPKSELVNEENAKVTGYNSNSIIEISLSHSNKVEGTQLETDSMLVKLEKQLEDFDNDTHKDLSEKVTGTPPMDTLKLKQGSNFDQEVLQSMGKKNAPIKGIGTSKFISTPVKSTSPITSNRDNIATPMNNNPALSTADKKKSTAKSLHKSLNFTLIREINRLTTSVMRKIESARVGAGSSKVSKESLSPLRTPTKASKNEVQQHSSFSLLTEDKRNLMASPIISSPSSLRTEERTASRKKKLEKKFDAGETRKVKLPRKLKDKAEIKIRKLRQSFCFKARPLPDFYMEREESERDTKGDPVTPPESPKHGRRPTFSVVERKSSSSPKRLFHGKMMAP